MAQFKASLPVFAPIKSETDSAITYENGAFVGKMVKTEVKPNKVEGSLYADDALAEYETEFKDADITLETSTIPVEVFASMFGETKTEGTGTGTPKLLPANSYEENGFKETLVSFYSHTGTHVDPPAHLFADRTTLDAFAPEQFLGKALVIDCTHLREGEAIGMKELSKYGGKADAVDFLLFATGWDARWGTEAYFGDYPCIDEEVLQHILNGNYKGIGFDVIGLDPIADENLTRHKALFAEKDIVNIENLKNLGLCGTEPFWFACLPLKLESSDGAPARAIAWFED